MSKTTNQMVIELNSIINEMHNIIKDYEVGVNRVYVLSENASDLITKLTNKIEHFDIAPKNMILPPLVIVNHIQNKYKVQICTKTRKTEYVHARHISCYFLKKFTKMYLTDIAEFVGMADHSTVLHAIGNVKKYMSIEPEYLDEIFQIEEELAKIHKEKYASNNISGVKSDRQAVLQSD